MPIDFFAHPCTNGNGKCNTHSFPCLASSTKSLFGLCDDPPPAENPAYLDENNPTNWIAEVSNPNSKEIKFKAVDNCVTILRPNNQQESRCDGFLIDGSNVIFVELKNRASSGWVSKGRDQLTITIDKFRQNYTTAQYQMTKAYVANKQRPLAVTNISSQVQQFFNDTGLLLHVNRNIAV